MGSYHGLAQRPMSCTTQYLGFASYKSGRKGPKAPGMQKISQEFCKDEFNFRLKKRSVQFPLDRCHGPKDLKTRPMGKYRFHDIFAKERRFFSHRSRKPPNPHSNHTHCSYSVTMDDPRTWRTSDWGRDQLCFGMGRPRVSFYANPIIRVLVDWQDGPMLNHWAKMPKNRSRLLNFIGQLEYIFSICNFVQLSCHG